MTACTSARRPGSTPACSPTKLWSMRPSLWEPGITWRQPLIFLQLKEKILHRGDIKEEPISKTKPYWKFPTIVSHGKNLLVNRHENRPHFWVQAAVVVPISVILMPQLGASCVSFLHHQLKIHKNFSFRHNDTSFGFADSVQNTTPFLPLNGNDIFRRHPEGLLGSQQFCGSWKGAQI